SPALLTLPVAAELVSADHMVGDKLPPYARGGTIAFWDNPSPRLPPFPVGQEPCAPDTSRSGGACLRR
ncbi:MAG: hypothetical protein AB1744_14400, partial [Candidatus Zixiibacteriota bacterium]